MLKDAGAEYVIIGPLNGGGCSGETTRWSIESDGVMAVGLTPLCASAKRWKNARPTEP